MTITKQISDDQIRGLLCGAFEGGSNYWYDIVCTELAPGLTQSDFSEGGKMQLPDNYWHWAELIPFVEGCSLIISDLEADSTDKKEYRLDRAALERGMQIMADKYAHHFNDFVSMNDDAITADVYLQCCIFGDVIYG